MKVVIFFGLLPLLILSWIALSAAREGRAQDLQPRAVLAEMERVAGHTLDLPHHKEVAVNIAHYADDLQMAGDMVSLGWHESQWRKSTCLGDELGDNGRAYGCWQTWIPKREGGVPWQVIRLRAHLRMAVDYCKEKGYPNREARFALYATGGKCSWAGAKERAVLAKDIQKRFEVMRGR